MNNFLQDDAGNKSHKRLMSVGAYLMLMVVCVANLFFGKHLDSELLYVLLFLIMGSTGMSILEKWFNIKKPA